MIFGCDNIDKKKLEVIEGVQLGTTYKVYENQLNSLGIQTKLFYSKSSIENIDQLEYNQIRMYVSDIFNLSDYRANDTKHYTILYPTTASGTDNVIGLSAIVGHTGFPYTINPDVFSVLKKSGIDLFNQNVSSLFLDEIKKMLNSKYGKPSLDGYESENNNFYVVEGRDVKNFIGNKKRKGRVTAWETEYLKIKLFEGLPSVDAVYKKDGYTMVSQPEGKEEEALVTNFYNYNKGQRPCYTYVYIKYELKPNVIKKLKLNIKKI